MLDERFAARAEEIERLIAGEGSDAEKAVRAGDGITRMLGVDPEWRRLLFEFTAYAVRNDEFRTQLVARRAALRARVAAALQAQADELGLHTGVPADEVALMASAMASGFAIERLLAGDEVPDELLGKMLLVFFTGLRALAAEPVAS
jgi:hypothetical protein